MQRLLNMLKDFAILDEAHTVEDVAGSHFGIQIGEGGIKYQLRHLYDPLEQALGREVWVGEDRQLQPEADH